MDAPTLTLPEADEDLEKLTDEQIGETLGAIDARGEELRSLGEEGGFPEDVVLEAERLANAKDMILGEQDKRVTAAADRKNRADAALAKLGGGTAETDATGDGTEEVTDDAAPAGDAPAGDAPAAELAVTPAPNAIAPVIPVIPTRAPMTLRRAAAKAPAAAAPAPAPAETGWKFKAAHGSGQPAGALLDLPHLAQLMTKSRLQFGSIPQNVIGDKVYFGTLEFAQDGPRMGMNYEANLGLMDGIVRSADEKMHGLVASGSVANCAPYTPLYDLFSVAEMQSPVEDSLPSIPADRGGIQFITPTDFRAVRAGVERRTNNASGHTKPVYIVPCPNLETAAVEPISYILQFDNLQYRVFPELVERYLADAAINFAAVKEIHYLDVIDTAATATTKTGTYGASRSLITFWSQAAVAYRKRNGMRLDSNIMLYAPDWAPELIKDDIANEVYGDANMRFAVTNADVNRFLAARNLTPVWYAHSATGLGQEHAKAQGTGLLQDYPDTVVSYLFSPGSFVRLNGGTLDVGLVRDSVLNGTNDLQIFYEEWMDLAFVGLEAVKVTATVCPTGTGPDPVTAFTCQTGS